MSFFSEDIIFLNQEIANQEEAIKLLTDQFYAKGLVEDDFHQAILKREKEYPTGLEMPHIGVAIPHTDSDKVKKAQLGFMSLTKPVEFGNMVDPDQKVQVSLIFMLALKESGDQLKMLQKLIGIFQDEESTDKLQACETETEFKELVEELFSE